MNNATNRIKKIAIALSCIGFAGLSACSSEPKDTIQEWVKKDIRQHYEVDVALSEPLELDYAADLAKDLRWHEAESAVMYKTTAFQFIGEDIADEWISVVWLKKNLGTGARYAQTDLEIGSENYWRLRL